MRKLALAPLLLVLLASPSWGQASRLFNGTDDGITFGDVIDIDQNAALSLAIIHKNSGTSPAASQQLVAKFQDTGQFEGYGLQIRGDVADDPYRFQVRSTTVGRHLIVNFPRSNDTLWHCVVVTYDGSSASTGVTAWVDRVSQTLTVVDDDVTGTSLHNDPLLIGQQIVSAAGASFFAGNLAYAAVFNVELSEGEASTFCSNPFVVARGRVGFWPLWENAADATFLDYSGAGLSGTAANDPDVSSDGPAVMIGGGQ